MEHLTVKSWPAACFAENSLDFFKDTSWTQHEPFTNITAKDYDYSTKQVH